MRDFRRVPRVERIDSLLVVGSGKGGVGKSTVSVNLAVALAQQGARVGLLDGDAYGPSVPLMLGVRKRAASSGWSSTLPLARPGDLSAAQKLVPLTRYGVKIMSVGFFVGEEQAISPLTEALGMLIQQLIYGVDWGPLDYLLIDLPPGTGEPQATLCRSLHLDGAILVTTPQDIARLDTAKSLAMFDGAGVPVLGLVWNMDGFVCPHCGERVAIFPPRHETGTRLDAVPVLGRVPIEPALASSGDQGCPLVVSHPDSLAARALLEVAGQVGAACRANVAARPAEEGLAGTQGGETSDDRED